MTHLPEYTPAVEDRIARAIWESIAHLTLDYSEVSFDLVLRRPRYVGVLGTLRNAAKRAVEAYRDGELGDGK